MILKEESTSTSVMKLRTSRMLELKPSDRPYSKKSKIAKLNSKLHRF